MYNLSNLEPKFRNYLTAEKVSSVTLRNYLSDLRHFSGWLIIHASKGKSLEENASDSLQGLNSQLILDYKLYQLNSGLPSKTINRRLSSLRKFFDFSLKEGLINTNPAKTIPNISNLNHAKDTSTAMNKSIIETKEVNILKEQKKLLIERSDFKINLNKYFIATILVIAFILVILPLKSYQSQKTKAEPLQLSSRSNRYLAFSGKLLDDLGNPITTKTDVIFRLYNTADGGKAIYTTSCTGEKGAVTPEVNGDTRILLGSDCDAQPLPSEIFTNNQDLYLGITVGTDIEMSPRQNIPNVGFAKNSDTIQGLSIGDNSSSVPYINQDGNLLIASNNSAIRSTHESANFAISSAETVTIESALAGDVILQATESGTIKLRTGGFTDSYTRFTINNEGNIGIGTLFPTYGFEVNDDIKIGSGNRLILASSSTDPSGENGAMYYNIQSNKFRCFQGGQWINCFNGGENNPIGGIYQGNIDNNSLVSDLEIQITGLNNKISQLENDFGKLNSLAFEKFNSLLSTNYALISSNLPVREKIVSPIIESSEVKTNTVIPQEENLIIDLSKNEQPGTTDLTGEHSSADSEINVPPAGPLASVIIRGLEGKTVAKLDSAGNASFSGQLTASDLSITNNATISGSLYANNIQSDNLNQLTQELDAARTDLNKIKSENISQLENKIHTLEQSTSTGISDKESKWDTELNEIQKLLAEIKNQPLPNPEYYQNLEDSQKYNSLTIDHLTSTGKVNFFDAAVSNSLTAGNLLIQDNSILSLAWELKLSALENIKLFEDGVIISKDGTIRAKGRVIAEAGVVTNKIEAPNTNDPVEINNLALQDLIINNKYLSSTASGSIIASTENFDRIGLSTPAIETQTAIAGTGLIPANSQEIIIYNSKIKDTSLIYLTPTDEIIASALSVSKKESCTEGSQCKPYFKVSSGSPSPTALSFNWLIIN